MDFCSDGFHLLGFTGIFLTLSSRKPFSFFDPGYKTFQIPYIHLLGFEISGTRGAQKKAFLTPGWRNWQTR